MFFSWVHAGLCVFASEIHLEWIYFYLELSCLNRTFCVMRLCFQTEKQKNNDKKHIFDRHPSKQQSRDACTLCVKVWGCYGYCWWFRAGLPASVVQLVWLPAASARRRPEAVCLLPSDFWHQRGTLASRAAARWIFSQFWTILYKAGGLCVKSPVDQQCVKCSNGPPATCNHVTTFKVT